MQKVNIEELKKLNYEEGAKLLEALGYVNNDSAGEKSDFIADYVSDDYYVLYDDEKQEEADRVSWVMYYNIVGELEDDDIDIIKSGWEAVGE